MGGWRAPPCRSIGPRYPLVWRARRSGRCCQTTTPEAIPPAANVVPSSPERGISLLACFRGGKQASELVFNPDRLRPWPCSPSPPPWCMSGSARARWAGLSWWCSNSISFFSRSCFPWWMARAAAPRVGWRAARLRPRLSSSCPGAVAMCSSTYRSCP